MDDPGTLACVTVMLTLLSRLEDKGIISAEDVLDILHEPILVYEEAKTERLYADTSKVLSKMAHLFMRRKSRESAE